MDGRMAQDYEFHPLLQEAYAAVHEWLAERDDTQGYKKRRPDLSSGSMKDVAAQFAGYFDNHFFTFVYTLDQILGCQRFLSWLSDNPHVCLVDIGRGAGAASAGFLELVVRLREGGFLSHHPDVLCESTVFLGVGQGLVSTRRTLLGLLRCRFCGMLVL